MTGRHRPAPSGAHAAHGGRHGRRAARQGPVGVATSLWSEAATVSVASVRRMPRPLVIPIALVTVLAVAFTAAAAAPGGDSGTPAAAPQWPYTSWIIPTVAPDLTASTTVVAPAPVPAKATAKAAKKRASAAAKDPRKKYVAVPADLAASGIPAPAMRAYKKAAQWAAANDASCGLKWELLAAIGRVESGHGTTGDSVMTWSGASVPGIYGPVLDGRGPFALIRDTEDGRVDRNKQYDRAVGPMQFLPASWAVVGRDGDGDGKVRVQDIDDAALGAAIYLCAGKQSTSTAEGLRSNIFRYNRSEAYVDLVIGVMQQYGARVPKIVPAEKAPAKKKATTTKKKRSSSTARPSGSSSPKPAPSPSPSVKPSPSPSPTTTTPPSEPPVTSAPASPEPATP